MPPKKKSRNDFEHDFRERTLADVLAREPVSSRFSGVLERQVNMDERAAAWSKAIRTAIAKGEISKVARDWEQPQWLSWSWPMAPKFVAVKIDHTDDLRNIPVVFAESRIYGVYFYNERALTHLAELEPSYYLHFAYLTSSDSRLVPDYENEQMQEWLNKVATEFEDNYYHARVIDAIPPEHKMEFPLEKELPDSPEEEAQREMIDDMYEYLAGNAVL